MANCSHCGVQEMMPFKCKFCGQPHCAEHRLPENHDCIGLQQFKEARERTPEKWIYEPFREDHKRGTVGRTVTKSPVDKLKDYFRTLDSKKVLNIILVFIVLSLLASLLKG